MENSDFIRNVVFLAMPIAMIFLSLLGFAMHRRENEQKRRDKQVADEAVARQQAIDTALRGAALDLNRRKAGLEALGFEEVESLQRFLSPSAPVEIETILVEDAPEEVVPVPEAHCLVPERVLTCEIVRGVTGIVSFYADAPVALRTIRFERPARYGLDSFEYSAGSFDPTGLSNEQMLQNAKETLPGVFMAIVTDPSAEEALRVRAAS